MAYRKGELTENALVVSVNEMGKLKRKLQARDNALKQYMQAIGELEQEKNKILNFYKTKFKAAVGVAVDNKLEHARKHIEKIRKDNCTSMEGRCKKTWLSPRSPYFPAITYALVIVALLVAPNYQDIISWFRKAVFVRNYSRKKIRNFACVSALIALSTSSVVVNGVMWYHMGYMATHVSNQIIIQMGPTPAEKIYVLDLPMLGTFFMASAEAELDRVIRRKLGSAIW